MADWTDDLPQAAQNYIDGHRLDEVECIISDLPGIARGKAVPASKFARQSYFHLPDSIFYQTITGGWGEAAGEDGFHRTGHDPETGFHDRICCTLDRRLDPASDPRRL